jgi:hypothetical protein
MDVHREGAMLIATFGPSTAWQSRTITWDEGRFLLEGHGPIGAEDVMEYDRQGHLVWESAGTRAWVGSRAASASRGSARRREAVHRSDAAASSGTAAAPQPGAAGQPRSESRRTIVLKRVMMVAIGILVIVNAALLLMFLGVIARL